MRNQEVLAKVYVDVDKAALPSTLIKLLCHRPRGAMAVAGAGAAHVGSADGRGGAGRVARRLKLADSRSRGRGPRTVAKSERGTICVAAGGAKGPPGHAGTCAAAAAAAAWNGERGGWGIDTRSVRPGGGAA